MPFSNPCMKVIMINDNEDIIFIDFILCGTLYLHLNAPLKDSIYLIFGSTCMYGMRVGYHIVTLEWHAAQHPFSVYCVIFSHV